MEFRDNPEVTAIFHIPSNSEVLQQFRFLSLDLILSVTFNKTCRCNTQTFCLQIPTSILHRKTAVFRCSERPDLHWEGQNPCNGRISPIVTLSLWTHCPLTPIMFCVFYWSFFCPAGTTSSALGRLKLLKEVWFWHSFVTLIKLKSSDEESLSRNSTPAQGHTVWMKHLDEEDRRTLKQLQYML